MASSQDSQHASQSYQTPVSPAVARRPFLDTSGPAINAAPVELDSTPVSPVAKQHSWPAGRQNDAAPGEKGIDQTISPEERQKREALLKKRTTDPAVVVDVPEEPGADELALADANEADTRAGIRKQ